MEDDQDEEICNCAVCSKRSEQLLLRSTTFLTLFLILLLHLLMFIVLLFLYGYGVYLNSTSTALPNTLIAFAPLLAISQLARGTGNRLGATGTGTSSRRPRSIPKHSEEGCSNLRMRPQCSREYSASEPATRAGSCQLSARGPYYRHTARPKRAGNSIAMHSNASSRARDEGHRRSLQGRS